MQYPHLVHGRLVSVPLLPRVRACVRAGWVGASDRQVFIDKQMSQSVNQVRALFILAHDRTRDLIYSPVRVTNRRAEEYTGE